jgi:hypothetical protein
MTDFYLEDVDRDDPYVRRLLAQDQWEVWDGDVRWGTVVWDGRRIRSGGPKTFAIDALLGSMRRGLTEEELFRSLPFRLTGRVSLRFPA